MKCDPALSPSTPVLHNRLMLFFFPPLLFRPPSSHTLLCHAFHTFVVLFFLLSLCPWSNQCRWWIIHSELCRLKLFDWQLYSHVSYIINLALLGNASMVKAIIGQGRASGLMEWIPLSNPTLFVFFSVLYHPSMFPCVLSFPFHFGMSSWRSPLADHTGLSIIWLRWPFEASLVSVAAKLLKTENVKWMVQK